MMLDIKELTLPKETAMLINGLNSLVLKKTVFDSNH